MLQSLSCLFLFFDLWIIKLVYARYYQISSIDEKGFAMKRSVTFLLSVFFLGITSETVLAAPPGRHRPPPHHHIHHSHASFGITFGAPLWAYPPSPFYYPYSSPPYYAYPQQTIVIQPSPTQYIQKNESDNTDSYWYYCSDPKGYYPYVPKCNANWQKVIPFPQETQ